MNCFNIPTLEVRNLDQSAAMAFLKDGLLKNDLPFFLEKTYPRDFANMLVRAEKYTHAKEAFKLCDVSGVEVRGQGEPGRFLDSRCSLELHPDLTRRKHLAKSVDLEVWTRR